MKQPDVSLVTSFIKNRDKESLTAYMGKRSRHLGREEANRWLRIHVLCNLDRSDAFWFWSDGLQSKYELTMVKVVHKCRLLLEASELIEEHHWSTESGTMGEPILVLSPDANHYLLDSLPTDRHAILKVATKLNTTPNLHKGGTNNEQCSQET